MFIVVVFKRDKNLNTTLVPPNRTNNWTEKPWYIYTTEYYAVIRKE